MICKRVGRVKSKGAVQWYLPKKKRPMAYSTVATSDLIGYLAQEHETVQDVYNAINFDNDAKAILMKFIDAGYADHRARDLFRAP